MTPDRVGAPASGLAESRRARVCVFAPAPLLTVTIEQPGDGRPDDEIHFHAGGQGFWIARLLAELGVDVVLCGSFGGEAGRVVRTLITDEGVELRGIETAGTSGSYVHDRRTGNRVETASMPAAALTRHELDELYGIVLVEGLDATVTVLGGPHGAPIVPPATYGRLARDLRENGTIVVADLSGEPLRCALDGGLDVLKVSEEELRRDGLLDDSPTTSAAALREVMGGFVRQGAQHVIATRAAEPALALIDGTLMTVTPPRLHPADHRGAGDSLTAGVAATLARGGTLADGIRLGSAAGALNVTRRGLATGRRDEIERLARHVQVSDWQAVDRPPTDRLATEGPVTEKVKEKESTP